MFYRNRNRNRNIQIEIHKRVLHYDLKIVASANCDMNFFVFHYRKTKYISDWCFKNANHAILRPAKCYPLKNFD